jgi:hypothetical protein
MPKTAQTFDSQFRSRIYGHGRVAVSAPKLFHTLVAHDTSTEWIVPGWFAIEKCAEKLKNRRILSFSAYVSTT